MEEDGSSLGFNYGVALAIGSRKNQQDAALVALRYFDTTDGSAEAVLGVLCDGIGGSRGGDVASQLCTQGMRDAFLRLNDLDFRSFFLNESQQLDQLTAELRDEFDEPLKAGSTMVSVIIMQSTLYWLSVGDSRAYIYRDGVLAQITMDHNYRKLLVEEGLYSVDEAAIHPNGEKLTSFMGIGGLKQIDSNSIPLQLAAGDMLLLCSDGLYKTLSIEEITALLDQGLAAQETADTLIRTTLEKQKPKQDNVSVILFTLF